MKSPQPEQRCSLKRNIIDSSSEAASKKSRLDLSNRTFLLSSGQNMPVVQFGTYKMKGEECYQSVLSALQAGYRGIDTASVYDNEKEVGRAIAESGVPREEIFVQTKLWRSFVGPGANGKPKCDPELRKSLKKLGLERLDLWLIHWPGPGRHLNYPPVRSGMTRPKVELSHNKDKMVPTDWTPQMRLDTYAEMSKHVGTSVGSLGVCNFSARQLRQLLEHCDKNSLPRPTVVQNECHPLLLADSVRNLCQEEGIVFQAYASLGAGSLGLIENPTVLNISKSYSVTPAQVLLRWGLQHNCALLPKSSKTERLKTNFDIWHFKIAQEDMSVLDGMNNAKENQNTMAGWLREHDPDYY